MINARVKTLMFNSDEVLRRVAKARRAALSTIGAYVRQRARTSIRRRRGPAPPGRPPHSHVGLLRRLIVFAYDPQVDGVVVGPLGLRNSPAPHALEYGDYSNSVQRGRRRRVYVRARPYMRPAMQAERARMPALFRNAMR